MKIAILYIVTGRYKIFFKGFYDSFEKNFLPAAEKHFFVFTDTPSDPEFKRENVSTIKRDAKGFPFDTLDRFGMFCSIKPELEKFDYIFFLNANLVCEEIVGEEILPNPETESGLVCAARPLMSALDSRSFPYERNEKSTAYIPFGEGRVYVQGGFIGGEAGAFLKMSKILADNISCDLKNGIVAVWHDESHLNRYVMDLQVKLLGLSYLCPDTKKYRKRCRRSGQNPKVILLEKSSYKYGGIDYLRGRRDNRIGMLEYILWKYFRCIYKMFKK
ncbi:MAG: hypothetical protein J6P03_04235 [Opitutales bacterium]|nr:hypothetical protein [Opitutales bacterium]